MANSFDSDTIINEFIECYPGFLECGLDAIKAVYKQVSALHGCFGGIKSSKKRKQAVFLAMAHYLTLMHDPAFAGGQIQQIRNRNDSITFAVKDTDEPFGFGSTLYGSMLERLIKNTTAIGFTSCQGYYLGRH